MRPSYFSEGHFEPKPKPKPKKSAYKSKAKPKRWYDVYTNSGRYVSSTLAVSEAKAVNNVRHNTEGDYVGNDGYYAVEA